MGDIKDLLVDTLEDLLEKEVIQFQRYLISGVENFKRIKRGQLENADRHATVDKMVEIYLEDEAVKITLTILKKMKMNHLALELETNYRDSQTASSKAQPGPSYEGEEVTGRNTASFLTTAQTEDPVTVLSEADGIKMMMKINFKEKIVKVYEGNSLEDSKVLLKDIYTEIYVIEGCTGGVNTEHEVRKIEGVYPKLEETTMQLSDLFKIQSDQNVLGTKVLTLGIAGVGKTASVHKFILDWAEDKCNQDLDFILFLPFRELNFIKEDKYSLSNLLLYFHQEFHNGNVKEILTGKCKVVFILDGLDESTLNLKFKQKKVTSVTEETTVDKLITNLIKGDLLPSALIWITSRPAAANQIPPEYINRVTEIQGFNDPQKEEYFKKRISDQEQAQNIISHIKTSKSLHILCHIPVFCSISAAVLQEILKKDEDMKTAPTTLTEMYTRFLLFQTRQSEKYSRTQNKDGSSSSCEKQRLEIEDILKLGKLAFLQLQKGQLIFYEKDLKECGIDVDEAVVYSGLCTRIFKKDEKIFSFVHLSFQEFLAAVFVLLTFSPKFSPLHQSKTEKMKWMFKHTMSDLLKSAVNKAMKSENGDLDLFLRFLLGLSLESNQRLLKSLQPEMEIREEKVKEIADYIKTTIKKTSKNPEKHINLFHCLSELKDNSLITEIQKYMSSGFQKLSSVQWSALVFVLLMSEETQEEFIMKKYRPSDEGLRRLLPVVKNTRRAVLADCKLSEQSCECLHSVLESETSYLKELDLSNNDLQDSGVEKLSAGLKSSHCKLEILRLADCNLSEQSCECLQSVLESETSSLKELDLSNNDLQDSGVEKLSAGLKSSHWKLEILRLSGCMVTQKGCSSLASALKSNPSHLRELDLTYNHPGESGVKELSDLLEDPHCKLDTLRVEHGGTFRITPGLKKYYCRLTLDPNTAHRHLVLSDENRKVKWSNEEQRYSDHPKRFDFDFQVLSNESVSGRCYWEVEWSREREDFVFISVSYKNIRRKKGWSGKSVFGYNSQSWSLQCYSSSSLCFLHNSIITKLSGRPSSRIGVYVDHSAGTLSFYNIFNNTLTLIHTVHTTFTQPLYTGFRVYRGTLRFCDK